MVQLDFRPAGAVFFARVARWSTTINQTTVPLNPTKNPSTRDAIAEPIPLTEHPSVTCAFDGCLMAHWRGVAVATWTKRGEFDSVAEMEKLLVSASQNDVKMSFVALIVGRMELPPATERARYGELTQTYDEQLVCSAVMFAGSGFWVSALRGVVTSILVVSRHRRRVFGNVEELANWVAPLHSAANGRAMESQELQRALNWMLAQPSVRAEHGIA